MISILIPTYNYNVYPLVNSLYKQVIETAIDFEILVYDDCSTSPEIKNEEINTLKNSSFVKLSKNIGRSAIRNKLANDAKFEVLLFLDADTKIFRNDFIQSYLDNLQSTSQIIYGGIIYQTTPPHSSEILRWKYGNSREALSVEERLKEPHLRFLTLNFLIKKNIFGILKFNEEIPNLRHEDTLFALDAKKKNIHVAHIDNPVIHLGLESSEVFLSKSIESVEALHLFVKQGLIKIEETALSRKVKQLKYKKMAAPIRLLFSIFEKKLHRNLLSKNPSLFYFDIYRLGYYLKIEKNHNA